MWWGGAAQSGWGMAMLQQYRTLFAVWFTYDAAGLPTWMVMPTGFWPDASTYEGRVLRASGSPWLARSRPSSVGAHRWRMRGLTQPYSTSTIRFTTITSVAVIRMPPCTTG